MSPTPLRPADAPWVSASAGEEEVGVRPTSDPAPDGEISPDRRPPLDYFEFPVLVVDDERENLLAFELNFRDQFEVITAESGPEALDVLAGREVAVIVSDQRMPGMSGVELLERTVERWPLLIRMILTGYTDHESLIDAINMGRIYKYVTKPWEPDSLAITIRRAIEAYALARENQHLVETLRRQNEELERIVHERTLELQDANSRLHKLAVTDGLTGLYNHRYFQEKWREEVRRARRYGEPLSLLMIDVDQFKNYNDTVGHPQGDVLLRDLASLLEQSVREVDVVARYGGEEFAIVLPKTPGPAARSLGERIRRSVEESEFPRREVQPGGRVTVSVGMACYPEDGETAEEILERADSAAYRAKRAGRNRVACWRPDLDETCAGASADAAPAQGLEDAPPIPDESVEIIEGVGS
ncbi:diguanylate cyclase [Myxococcota bacterium]|nr:diguanylate cyclase [Myxococcota bacterium]